MIDVIHVVPLTSDEQLVAAFPLMAQLRDRIRAETFVAEIRRQEAGGYHLAGGFVEDRLVALAGYRRSHTLSRGAHVFVDDLITDAGVRGKGYAAQMLRWIGGVARESGAPRVYLDSRDTARGFYEKCGFTMLTSIPCWIDAQKLL